MTNLKKQYDATKHFMCPTLSVKIRIKSKDNTVLGRGMPLMILAVINNSKIKRVTEMDLKKTFSKFQIDFDQWLMNGISHELSLTGQNYRIIRRRAVWLIGQWSGVKLSPELRPKLYQVKTRV